MAQKCEFIEKGRWGVLTGSPMADIKSELATLKSDPKSKIGKPPPLLEK